MELKKLGSEFYAWLWRKQPHTKESTQRISIHCCLFIPFDVFAFLLLIFIESSWLTKEGYFLKSALQYLLVWDITMYLIRLSHVMKEFREINILIAYHNVTHICLCVIFLRSDCLIKTQAGKSIGFFNKILLFLAYFFIFCRTIYHSVMIVYTILCAPCIIKSILEGIREDQHFYIEQASISSLNEIIMNEVNLNNDYRARQNHLQLNLIQEEHKYQTHNHWSYDPQVLNSNPPRASSQIRHPPRNSRNARPSSNPRNSLHTNPNSNDPLSSLIEVKYSSQRSRLKGRDCPICHDQFGPSSKQKEHIFHSKCIKQWLRNKPECPICRLGIS
ncbi:unnamed protein product [Moneuplotes crassus]|uniref:RING-type domain-containing protein n=1 Tax=Euplotes crassus TaxID=5936 RepID=A0AAD1XKK6_EUPCR|nr:unnamed protein product [Moneuplotes crassus]